MTKLFAVVVATVPEYIANIVARFSFKKLYDSLLKLQA